MGLDKRRRLYGKIATEKEIAQEVARLYLGNPDKKQEPLGITDILKTLGYKERKSIYNYLEIACNLGFLEKDDQNNRYKKPEKTAEQEFREFSELHPILEDPLVQEWDSEMKQRKNGKFKGRKKHIANLEKFCNQLRLNPIQLIQSREATKKYLTAYSEGLIDGTISRRKKSVKSAPEQAFKPIKDAVRNFIMFHGISIPKGTEGVWCAKVLSHGNYSDIRWTDEQILEADRYIKERWGLDSDIYRLVFVGIESCARKQALLTMKLDWTVSTDPEDNSRTFYMTAYETKTEHIKGGRWMKMIQRPDTQKSLELLKERRTTDLLYENPKNIYRKLTESLKEIYKHLGLTHHYYYEHAVHSLRHIGAHYWLKLTHYDYVYIAKIGGWNIVQELIDSYGEMPPEVMAEKIKLYRKGVLNISQLSVRF